MEKERSYQDIIDQWERDKIIDTTPDENDSEFIVVGDDFEDDMCDYIDDDIDVIEEDDYIEDDNWLISDEEDDFSPIDENYVPDKWEKDLFDSDDSEDDIIKEVSDLEEIIRSDNDEPLIDFENIETSVRLNDREMEKKERKEKNVKKDDKIAKNIAKKMLDSKHSAVDLTLDDIDDEKYSWVNDDMFGNNIENIVAEPPKEEKIDENFAEGNFDEWAKDNK